MLNALSRGVLPLCFVLLILTLGAARPFERVPQDDAAYAQLAALGNAGLLEGYDLPTGELSRLEAAVLVQQALGHYGQAQLAGRQTDATVEAALTSLLTAFSDELGQLGARTPSLSATGASAGLVQRVTRIEDELAASDEDAGNTYLSSLYPEEEAPAEAAPAGIESALYGKFYLQAQSSTTHLHAGGSTDYGNVKLNWGELGWDAKHKDWSAHFSTLWNDADESVGVFEAWAKYKNPRNGWFAQLGQVLLPFGNNDYYFPTYPAVNDLGFTTAHGIGTGVEGNGWGASAYAYNPKVDIVDEQDQVSDYSFVWNVSERAADACHNGWKLRAGYDTHLASSDIRLAGGGPHHVRVPAYNVFGRYDWGGNRFHLLADYTAALDRFDSRDMDANNDDIGDKPSALNTEFVYEPHPDSLWGLSYQAAREMANYAETRYGVLFGKRLDDMALFKLEYTHGIYGDYITADQNTDDRLVAEVFIGF
jgi:hypothetical protein